MTSSITARESDLTTAPIAGRKKQLRILMVTARYLPLMGGIETHVHEVGTRLANKGHDINILTTDLSGNLPGQEFSSGMTITRVPAWPPWTDYYVAPKIFRIIKAQDWDFVHIQGYHTFVAPFAMLAARKANLPYIITFHSGGHSSSARTAIRKIQWAVSAPLWRNAAQLIGVSQYEADHFSKIMGVSRDRFVVIPNGAELPQTTPAEKSEGRRLVVSIGRLEKYKGHQRVIEAMPHVLKRQPDTHLRVLGEGPYKRELQKLVQQLKLEDYVTVGGIPPKERTSLAALLAQADLVTLLSDYEAHPVAVMEAASLGKPVLTTDTSGFIEMAEQGLVRSIPLNANSNEISHAMMEEMNRDTDLSKPVVHLPRWQDCADRLENVYFTVAAKRDLQ